MPHSCKFSVTASRQPTNTFYVWYAELCRRSNSSPVSAVKPVKSKNNTVLDLTADRIKPEEWTPILNALRLDTSLHVVAIRSRVAGCKFLYDINTEDKVRHMKRRYGSLWTDYVLRSLTRSLACCLKNTEVLCSLELDGLPFCGDYLEMLLQSLRNNRTLKMLSVKGCPISDRGCQQICTHLRLMPNIEVLNLSSCELSSISGQYLAAIIKHQQINRYCESWHQSLRYEDPVVGRMAGLKRLTLNNNPNMGDEGLSYILDQLDDDLWIKALDMQKCNITENIARRLIDIVEYSRSLEVVDFRNNERLSFPTVERILDVLQKKQRIGNDPEYQWCVTTSTLCDFGSSFSNLTGMTGVIQKSRSAPLRQIDLTRNSAKPVLRRVNTLAMIDLKTKHDSSFKQPDRRQLNEMKKQYSTALNNKLHVDISKTKQTQKVSRKLDKRFDCIPQLGNMPTSEQFEKTRSRKLSRLSENVALDGNRRTCPGVKEVLIKKDIKSSVPKLNTRDKSQSGKKIAHNRPITPKKSKQLKMPTQTILSSNTVTKEEPSLAQEIFQTYLYKDNQVVDDMNDESEDTYFTYYEDSEPEENYKFSNNQLLYIQNDHIQGLNSSATEIFLRDVVDEDLSLHIDSNRSPSEASARSVASNSPKHKAQNYLKTMMLEAG